MRTVSSKMSGWKRYSLAMDKKPADLTSMEKQKQSEAEEELINSKKNDTENAASLKRVIHLKIPHVGERIFESIDTPGLIKCLEVSQTWNELAGNVLIKRWKRIAMAIPKLMLEACQKGQIKVVQLLLERYYNSEESGLT